MAVLWNIIPYGLVGRYLNVAETCCYHIQERGSSARIQVVYVRVRIDSAEFPRLSDWSIFWDVVPCRLARGYQCFDAADSSTARSTFLWNVNICWPNCMVSHHRRQGQSLLCIQQICAQVSHVRIFSREKSVLYCLFTVCC